MHVLVFAYGDVQVCARGEHVHEIACPGGLNDVKSLVVQVQ